LRRSRSEIDAVREQLADTKFELQQLKLATPQNDNSNLQLDLKENSQDASTVLPSEDGQSQDTQLLAAAYQQISVLNTQLAHLYTELTMARTEAQQWRQQVVERQPYSGEGASGDPDAAQRQGQQIADLVSDIRHLQLDLEYHQQKLEQMIEDKQQMMRELQFCKEELAEATRISDEREQMLKHREVDLAHLQHLVGPTGDAAQGGLQPDALVALRHEMTAKDSALIVSHYELHKEKLMRDRLEQKNLKLMERMQKLMMVVESMRKDNGALERSLAVKDRSFEEKDLQLRQITQAHKARSAQKNGKVPRSQGNQRGGYGDGSSLPPLDRAFRSDGFGGVNPSLRSTGMSTPKTPRVG